MSQCKSDTDIVIFVYGAMLSLRSQLQAKIVLKVISVVSFVIAFIWFVVEPGFEPILAFLGGTAALISSFVDSGQQSNDDETSSNLVNQTVRHDKQYDYLTSSLHKKPVERPKIKYRPTQDKVVEDKLYDAFISLRNLSFIILIFSLFMVCVLTAMMIARLDGIPLIGFIWLVTIFSIFIFMMKTLYRRISVTGYYGKIKLVDTRETIKHSLQKRTWGNVFTNIYMEAVISFLLKTKKREADKLMGWFG
ncbi:MAG: hypothetical protein AAF702_37645 [Chloroflexota bacterium]